MATFVDESGNTVAHFDRGYWHKYDDLGKKQVALFYAWKGGQATLFDTKSTKDYKEPDLKVVLSGKMFLVDAEVKSDRDWEFISRGVHVPARKFGMILKYPSYQFVVCLVKGDGKQLLLVPRRALVEAQNVVGHRGFPFGGHPTTDSDDYVGPGPNGADKVYKWTIRGEYEHFLEIPEKWTSLWEVKEPGVDYLQRRDAEMGEWRHGD